MKTVTKAVLALSVVSSLLLSNLATFADEIGYVDVSKIISSYPKAQQVISDTKTKDTDLQKMLIEAKTAIKNAKKDSEKKSLEEKYNKSLQEKQAQYRQEYTAQWEPVQKEITTTISSVAKTKKINAVFKKESLILGGTDLTDAVISELNKK